MKWVEFVERIFNDRKETFDQNRNRNQTYLPGAGQFVLDNIGQYKLWRDRYITDQEVAMWLKNRGFNISTINPSLKLTTENVMQNESKKTENKLRDQIFKEIFG